MIRTKTNVKDSDAYTLAIAAVVEKYTTNSVQMSTDELADVLAYLCDQRDTALYVEWRDAEEATKAETEQEADHAES